MALRRSASTYDLGSPSASALWKVSAFVSALVSPRWGVALAPVVLAAEPAACATASHATPPPPRPTAVELHAQPVPSERAPAWPPTLAAAMAGHGAPHAQPIALPRDGQGRSRWLAFVGSSESALGAWHVALAADGRAELDAVERWPSGVRVVGGVVENGVAYVLLESLAVLDQPSGLRGGWADSARPTSPLEASPMALADARSTTELAARLRRLPPDNDASGLVGALRGASVSTAALAEALASDGADVQIAWQSLFTQRVGHLGADDTASSPLAAAVLAILREALMTQACGVDACEAWTETGRAVVRFVRQDGRWTLRTIIEEAPVTRSPTAVAPPRVVPTSPAVDTESVLRARAREVRQVLGQAPLTQDGGTIGVGLTDLAPDAPIVVFRESGAIRLFTLDASAPRLGLGDSRWEAAFADLDGDGRTDVVLRMSGQSAAGLPIAWTQAYLAPPPSVQVSSLEPDLASALAMLEARDAASAAQAAAAIPIRRVPHEDACRLLTAASTPSGFRHEAAPDARLFHFDEPGMPTWRPKVVPLGKLAVDDVRGIGGHCSELVCSTTRPYCAWTGGADSEHFWFDWRDGRLEIIGAADYDGE